MYIVFTFKINIKNKKDVYKWIYLLEYCLVLTQASAKR